MKKLLNTLFIFSALFIIACKTNNVSKITEEVKVISKCCEKLSEEKSGNVINTGEYKGPEAKDKVSSILPGYFWDTKMMIW